MKGRIRKIEDLMKKEELEGRRKVVARRGRKKASEQGILQGEQSIRKFIISERKILTPKRKITEGNEKEENMETGSERKRRKKETRRDNAKRNNGTVKQLLHYFNGECSKEKENGILSLSVGMEKERKEKEGSPRNSLKEIFLKSEKDLGSSQPGRPINDKFLETSFKFPVYEDKNDPIFPKIRPLRKENNEIGTILPNNGKLENKNEKLALISRKQRKSQNLEGFGDNIVKANGTRDLGAIARGPMGRDNFSIGDRT